MDHAEQGLILGNEVYAVVGAAMEVANELGSGFLETVYQEAMAIELRARRIPFVAQPAVDVCYKGRVLLKHFIPDFICFGQLVVEIKAIKQLTNIEEAQLLNYLKATALPAGVLLNFGSARLEWKRMVLTKPPMHA